MLPEVTLRPLFEGATGRGIRIAVIDSGVSARHPHIGRVAGGIAIGESAPAGPDYFADVLGHGTAVMAAIQEKAPGAEYFAVRVFHDALRTSAASLILAIEWAIENRMDIANLSLGTLNFAHEARFAEVAARAEKAGTLLVAAREADGDPCLPGSLAGVLGTNLDWECDRDRDRYRCEQTPGGVHYYASGYPRPVPGVALKRNLHGISFAVANMSGFAALAAEKLGQHHAPALIRAALAAEVKPFTGPVHAG